MISKLFSHQIDEDRRTKDGKSHLFLRNEDGKKAMEARGHFTGPDMMLKMTQDEMDRQDRTVRRMENQPVRGGFFGNLEFVDFCFCIPLDHLGQK